MPIKGLTGTTAPPPYLPSFGKLRKGAAKTEGRPGQDLDHFRMDFHEQYNMLYSPWIKMFGDKPAVITGVRFISNDPDEIFSAWLESYRGNRTLKARSDGEYVIKWWDKQAGAYSFDPQPYDENAWPDMKKVGRLRFIIPEFTMKTGYVGTFTLETGGYYDLRNIDGALRFFSDQGLQLNDGSLLWTLSRQVEQTPKRTPKGMIMAPQANIYLQPEAEQLRTIFQMQLQDAERPALPAPAATFDEETGEVYDVDETPPDVIDTKYSNDDDLPTNPLLPEKKKGWEPNNEELTNFIESAQQRFGLDNEQVLQALQVLELEEFTIGGAFRAGVSKIEGVGACVARSQGYNINQVNMFYSSADGIPLKASQDAALRACDIQAKKDKEVDF